MSNEVGLSCFEKDLFRAQSEILMHYAAIMYAVVEVGKSSFGYSVNGSRDTNDKIQLAYMVMEHIWEKASVPLYEFQDNVDDTNDCIAIMDLAERYISTLTKGEGV